MRTIFIINQTQDGYCTDKTIAGFREEKEADRVCKELNKVYGNVPEDEIHDVVDITGKHFYTVESLEVVV